MLAFLLAAQMSATIASPTWPFLAQSSVATEAPAPRKVCRNEKIANSRFTRRICTTVQPKQPATKTTAAPPPVPLMTDFGVGMNVVDAQGEPVGVLTAVAADTVTVKTDKHEAQLPKSSLTISAGKALFGLTQAELNASVEKTIAAMPAAELTVGAIVKGVGGATLGTVDAVAGDNVTIKLASGQTISIPRSGIAVGADGSGMIGLTAAELDAQVKAAQPTG